MKKFLLSVGLIATAQSVSAQAGIGTATPNGSSVLDLSSTTKGFLPPRMTASERGSISNPATGLMVYQTDVPAGLYVNNGTPSVPNWVNAAPASGVNIALMAQASASQTIPSGAPNTLVDIVFGSYATNPAFNGTTYTVPASGIYQVEAMIVSTTTTVQSPWPAILVNGSVAAYGVGVGNGNITDGSGGRGQVSAVLSLTQGQTLKIAAQNPSTAAVNTTTTGTTRLSIIRLQ